jgi:tetratricopeptide (TPR) repeat protein
VFLTGVTVLFLWWGKRFPYLPVGWFWYLGTLVPMIGLVQVGVQARADRYTYFPLIGVFLLLTWGAADLAARLRLPRAVAAVGAAAVLLACLFATLAQVGYWGDSITLWEHALRAAGPNDTAHYALGQALAEERGDTDAAIAHLAEAVRLNPSNATAHYSLGVALERKGRPDLAAAQYREALGLNADLVPARINLGLLYLKAQKTAEAGEEFAAALRADPGSAKGHNLLGVVLARQGRYEEALRAYDEAVRLNPAYPEAFNNRGIAALRMGDLDRAAASFSRAVEADPHYAAAYNGWAQVLYRQGKNREAVECCRRALAHVPQNLGARCTLAFLLAQQGDTAAAHAEYQRTLRQAPDWPREAGRLAWSRATDPDVRKRNGPEAVLLATQACQATAFQDPELLDVLAVAHAEVGQFAEAEAEERQALALARSRPDLAARIEGQLRQFEKRQPLRVPRPR